MGIKDAMHQACTTFVLFLCGIFIFFPAGIVITGWNEKRSVCRLWAIEASAENLNLLDCNQHNTDLAGKAVVPGELGFVSCPIDQSTFPTFDTVGANSFVGLNKLEGLFGAAGTKAAAMEMTVKQWQCQETCSQYECSNRRLGEPKAESGDKQLQERQLKTKSRSSNQQQCDTCVAWTHAKVLSSESPAQSYNRLGDAQAACGMPLPLPVAFVFDSDKQHAQGGLIGSANGSAWTINAAQSALLPINTPVILPERAPSASFKDTPSVSSLTMANTYVTGNTLRTCTSQSMGCYEITFMQAVPTRMTMLGKVSAVAGEMDPSGWMNSGYWLCKGDKTQHVDRFCPAIPSIDKDKGYQACGEDITTAPALLQNMKDANFYAQWGYRVGGFFILFMSFSCFFGPIKACLGFATDLMDEGTECIPCVGCCVDFLTDIFMKMVGFILGVLSCCCACGWFLTVCTVMWIVLKPWYGVPMLVGACCFCGGAGGLIYHFKGGKGDDGEDETSRTLSDEDYDYE